MSYNDPYAPQDVYAQQQQLGQSGAYGQPGAPPQQYGQPLQPPYGQPGVPPQQYGQPGAFPQQYGQPVRGSNPWANRALFSGCISIVFALITLFSTYGFAGLITGSFAIYRGITALNMAKRLPGNPGQVQAIVAIVLGALALLFVLVAFMLRSAAGY